MIRKQGSGEIIREETPITKEASKEWTPQDDKELDAELEE